MVRWVGNGSEKKIKFGKKRENERDRGRDGNQIATKRMGKLKIKGRKNTLATGAPDQRYQRKNEVHRRKNKTKLLIVLQWV